MRCRLCSPLPGPLLPHAPPPASLRHCTSLPPPTRPAGTAAQMLPSGPPTPNTETEARNSLSLEKYQRETGAPVYHGRTERSFRRWMHPETGTGKEPKGVGTSSNPRHPRPMVAPVSEPRVSLPLTALHSAALHSTAREHCTPPVWGGCRALGGTDSFMRQSQQHLEASGAWLTLLIGA